MDVYVLLWDVWLFALDLLHWWVLSTSLKLACEYSNLHHDYGVHLCKMYEMYCNNPSCGSITLEKLALSHLSDE